MDKHSLMNSKKLIFFILPVVLIVAVVGFILVNKQLQEYVSDNKTLTTLTESQYPVDIVNDGVYTNYKYGFRFEYPKETFTIQIPFVDYETDGWVKQEWSQGKSVNNLLLSIGVYDAEKSTLFFSEYKKTATLSDGASIGKRDENYSLKLDTLNKNNHEILLYYNEIDIGADQKKVYYSYIANWDSNGQIVFLQIGGNNKELVLKNKSLFINIAESIDFL